MAGTLRITGGTLVRQRIKVPLAAEQNLTRPASDRVREAVFSSLKIDLIDAKILDLFSGSGIYAFEGLSRRARSAVLVEKNPQTAECIRENIKKLKLESFCRVILGDATCFQDSQKKFDIVFVDPPYVLKLQTEFWENLKSQMALEALVVFRCHKKSDFICPPGYQIVREKTYGGTWVAFLNYQ